MSEGSRTVQKCTMCIISEIYISHLRRYVCHSIWKSFICSTHLSILQVWNYCISSLAWRNTVQSYMCAVYSVNNTVPSCTSTNWSVLPLPMTPFPSFPLVCVITIFPGFWFAGIVLHGSVPSTVFVSLFQWEHHCCLQSAQRMAQFCIKPSLLLPVYSSPGLLARSSHSPHPAAKFFVVCDDAVLAV